MNVDELTVEIELRNHYFDGVSDDGDSTCACGVGYTNWEEHLSIVVMRLVRDDEQAKESVDLNKRIRKLKKRVRNLKNRLDAQEYELRAMKVFDNRVSVDPSSNGGSWVRKVWSARRAST